MIDLHVHTKASDNSFTSAEIISMAREKGITHLAVTDHDTTRGLPEAVELGRKLGVKIIPGIEISAFDYKRKKRAHILGLYIKEGYPSLNRLCDPLVQSRNQASHKMVDRLAAVGYEISWEEVERYAGGTGVFKQHIMHALLAKGYCRGIYGDLYKKLFNRGNGAEPQGLAYIPLLYIDVHSAIRAVKEAGGIPVLAHPGHYGNFEAVNEWAASGLEGIEVFHPIHTAADCRLGLEYARRFNLFVTGGSDFHGFYDEAPVELGCPELDEDCIAWLESGRRRICFK